MEFVFKTNQFSLLEALGLSFSKQTQFVYSNETLYSLVVIIVTKYISIGMVIFVIHFLDNNTNILQKTKRNEPLDQ